MKVRLVKKATKGKGKTWKKGESSTTNAETKKYRSKVNLFSPLSIVTNENLTADNLLFLQSDISDTKPDDSMSLKSNNSFASIYTNCSNISFNRFLDVFDSSSPHHREMVAVLATVTELIKEQNGQENDTEYFAVLMTILESSDKEETLTATITLLYMVIKRLPLPVIRLKFSDICDTFIKVLDKYHSTPNTYMTSNLIKCLSHLLKKQEMAVWQMPSTQRICDILLAFTLHAKPRIRRSAKRAMVSIIKGSSIVWEKDEPVPHLFTPTVIKFIIKKIKETNISENVNNVLYMLNLLSELIAIAPQALLKTCCEILLGLITLGSGLMVNSLRVFMSLFSSTSPMRELTADMNLSLIRALNDHQPSFNDVDSLSLWINVIKQAYISLFLIKSDSCIALLPMAFSSIAHCWQSDSKILHISVNASLEELIREILTPSFDVISTDTMIAIMETFENSLTFKYQNAWCSVLSIIGKLFQHLGPKNPTLVLGFLRTLSNLREGFDINLVPEIDKSIGMAIKNMGPEPILLAIPLEIDIITNDLRHSWMLPLLRDYIENTKLAHFINYFIPLAKSIEKNIALFTKQQNLLKVKVCQALFYQIWSLLPSFCRKPTDLTESFTSNFAKTIGAKITDDKRLRIHCLAALRTLIRKCTSKEEVNHLSRFAKNYLPILFNIYTCKTNSVSDRLPVLETIQIYLGVTEAKIIKENYEAIRRNLKKFDEDTQLCHLLLDLIRLFVPYLSSSELKELFFSTFVVRGLSDKSDRRRQKKCYRIIEVICKNEASTEFFQHMDQNIIEMLIKFINNSPGEARSAPIKALSSLLENNVVMKTIDIEEYLEPLLASIIDCMKQTSSRTRLSTLFLISILCKTLNNGYSVLLKRFLDLYNNAENMDNSVILFCISNIIIRFREQIDEKTQVSLFYQFISLGETQDRSLIKSMLYFIKEWIKPMDRIELMKYTNDIIVSITTINEETRKPFRSKIRDILCKIGRKIGFDILSQMVPDEYSKVIRNLKKLEARKAKKSNVPSESTAWTKMHHSKTIKDILDSSSNSENELEEKISKMSIKSKARTWIEENEDEILDLTEPNVTRKLYSTNINKIDLKKKSKDEFKMDQSGKLIIEPIGVKSKRKREEINNESDDSFEDKKEIKTIISSKVTSSKQASTKSYKPGGKGIHRPLKKRKNDLKGLKTGEEYRSKKARGDIKKKGKPDPYAYIPLNQSILSKRKKAKYQTQFKNIIGAAKEGAIRGSKIRNKKTKKLI